MSHTPGPWAVDDDTLEIFSIVPGHSTGWIAKVLGNDDNGRPLSPDEMAANARLIAAAPEMLSALRAARDDLSDLLEVAHLTDEGVADTTAVLDQVIAAIAKAEGRGK
jgi:hypothetical protein